MRLLRRFLLVGLAALLGIVCHGQAAEGNGPESFALGKQLWEARNYDEAAPVLWRAVLLHGQTPAAQTYDVQEVFSLFMQCYMVQDRLADGLAYVSLESFRRGQDDMGATYLQQALQVDPQNEAALQIQVEFGGGGSSRTEESGTPLGALPGGGGGTAAQTTAATSPETSQDPFYGKTPEDLYEIASGHFANKEYEPCADIFELSCRRSGRTLGPSCSNAIYCRSMLVDWGFNGTQYEADMQEIVRLTEEESRDYKFVQADGSFVWKRSTSVHPHMMLGYPVDPLLKKNVAESVAFLDEIMARAERRENIRQSIPPLPADLPFRMDPQVYAQAAAENPQGKIRIGFVGSGFNSKAVLYLSQDMFRFFDKSRFEVHIFSFGPADNPLFIHHGMRGVDWRERIQANVDYFHDCQAMKMDHIKAARFIHDKDIHILMEWDGYARQGERAQGLFALRPAPIQILHQEYLGTSGALYVDYLFTDEISSPRHLENLYAEKLIYMPNHFFSKGHAMQAEVVPPALEYTPKETPYRLGTGSPQENRCLAPANVGPAEASFVFCNFNKLLKNNPDTLRSWIRILRDTPDAILCLLENPKESVDYVRKFVHEAAGTSDGDWDSFVPGDGDELNERIHFLPWERNPFDHQQRNRDFCNLMLDSFPYNGHTVAQDALYAGVPIVTRSDGLDMASRVSTSANVVLGMEHLNAQEGIRDYQAIAVRMATNAAAYEQTRTQLLATALQRNPMHPYWDVPRYVKNFETGLTIAWERFLKGLPLDHIFIEESAEAAKGTYDSEIAQHPPDGARDEL